MASLWLAACCLPLAAVRDPEAWSLKLLIIDHDPGAKLLPSIAHDLELSCDGQQLGLRGMFNFYCEFFHFFLGFISFLTSRRISSRASAILSSSFVAYSIIFLSLLALVLEIMNCYTTCTRTCNDLTNLSSGKSLNELKLDPTISQVHCQAACCLELAACSFFLS